MSDHDPLCQASLNGNDDIYFCVCEFITKVRADGRTVESPLADLRAQVEALKDQYAPFASYEEAVDDVLALIDEAE